MRIFVTFITGKSIPLELNASEFVVNAKQKIEANQGIPLCRQSLFYDDEELEDGLTLSESKVKEDTTLNLVLRKQDKVRDTYTCKMNTNACLSHPTIPAASITLIILPALP